MKNVLTFLTVAMLAIATQAVTVPWISGTMYQVNPDGTKSSSKMNNSTAKGTGYLFLISEEAYNALEVADIVSTYFDVDATGVALKSGVTATLIASTGKTGVLTHNTELDGTPGNKYYAAVVYTFVDSEGKMWVQANKGWTSIAALGNPNNEASGNLGTIGGFGATGWYKAVPEPTTVALLAFGLAAVGLKRKRA